MYIKMEFIEKNVRVEEFDDEANDAMYAGGDEANDSDMKFIDGETNVQDQNPSDYCLMNITRDLQEAAQNQSIAQEHKYAGFEKSIQKFEQDFKIFVENQKAKENFDFCQDSEKIAEVLG